MIMLATDTSVIVEAALWGFLLAFVVSYVAWRVGR